MGRSPTFGKALAKAWLLPLLGLGVVVVAGGYGGHPWWRVGPAVFNEPTLLVGSQGHYWWDDDPPWADSQDLPGAGVTVNVDVSVENRLILGTGGLSQGPRSKDLDIVVAPDVDVQVQIY